MDWDSGFLPSTNCCDKSVEKVFVKSVHEKIWWTNYYEHQRAKSKHLPYGRGETYKKSKNESIFLLSFFSGRDKFFLKTFFIRSIIREYVFKKEKTRNTT